MQEIAEIMQTPWADILRSDGWVETNSPAPCGCPVWTVPGAYVEPVRATAHSNVCEALVCADVIGSLHVRGGPARGAVGQAMQAYGTDALTKIQVINHRRLRGRDAIPADLAEQLESEAERRFWSAYTRLQPRELVGLVPQHSVLRYRVDFAIPRRKIAIEVDGYKWHSGKEVFVRDRDRERELEEAGWRVVRFAGKRACEEPDRCVHEAARWVASLQGGI